ncbi:hypothetical protein HY78_07830 [Rhizorhabdus wittichii DC-6]|nr:hypothetical protein HY78_07830 [Rhizorhabdus wittichii DC-6]
MKSVIVPSVQSPPSMLKLHDFCNRAGRCTLGRGRAGPGRLGARQTCRRAGAAVRTSCPSRRGMRCHLVRRAHCPAPRAFSDRRRPVAGLPFGPAGGDGFGSQSGRRASNNLRENPNIGRERAN